MNLTQKHKSEVGIECNTDSGILYFTVAGPDMGGSGRPVDPDKYY